MSAGPRRPSRTTAKSPRAGSPKNKTAAAPLRRHQLRQFALPGERGPDDEIDVVVLRHPLELILDELRLRDDRRRIASTPRNLHGRDRVTGAFLDRANDLENREPVAVAAVEHAARMTGAQRAQRANMRLDEVRNVDVIADAGAVGC